MSAPAYSTLVVDFLNKMDDMTSSFLVENYQALAHYMATPIALLSTLYLIITGYLVLSGTTKMSTKSFLNLAITIGFVNMFALNWLYFSDYFVALFMTTASEISSVGANSHLFQFPHLSSSGTGINDALQTVLSESVDVGIKAMQQGSYRNWMPILVGFNFIGGGTLIVAFAAIELSMIKFFICLLLSTGPLFIALYLFEQTKSAFKVWLSLLAGFSFALIFAGITIGMSMHWMHWVVGGLHADEALDIKVYTLAPLFFVEVLALVILWLVIPMAKQIGGAVGGSHVGDAIGGMAKAVNPATSLAKGAALKLHTKLRAKN
jgi:type IV secretion system protein VirB6